MVSVPTEHSFTLVLLFLWFGRSYACEGSCIVGLTNALIGNYSQVVENVLGTLASNIAKQLLPGQAAVDSSKILVPVYTSYQKQAYNAMETAVFPGFFHGKCQVNGINPKGCPDPNCPIVCGTPGSIIHFYSTFVNIAFNTTSQVIANLTSATSSSSQFDQIQRQVMSTCQGNRQRMRRFAKFLLFSEQESCPDQDTARKSLKQILGPDNIKMTMQRECGGSDLPNCNWIKQGMKQYVLSWP